MKTRISLFRKRLTGVLSVLPLILGLCYVAYKYGPGPIKAEQVAIDAKTEAKPAKAVEVETSNSQLLEFFGMRETAVAKGQANLTPAAHLDSLEALYLQRGYQKIDFNDPPKKKRKTSSRRTKEAAVTKYFQREETNGIGSISAIGKDADYTTDRQSTAPFSFSTLVAPAENGGTEWAAYKLEIDRDKLAQVGNLEDGDFPGPDPINIPRPPGLQRIYATSSPRGSIAIYKSRETENSLLIRYLQEMPRRGWRLNADITSRANNVTPGVMYFTQGQTVCMIWITMDKETGTTNVTINLH